MNGLIIFNGDDGTLLLHKKYVVRFGFDDHIKESHDVLYLATMLFTLYCNANFIQVQLHHIDNDIVFFRFQRK